MAGVTTRSLLLNLASLRNSLKIGQKSINLKLLLYRELKNLKLVPNKEISKLYFHIYLGFINFQVFIDLKNGSNTQN